MATDGVAIPGRDRPATGRPIRTARRPPRVALVLEALYLNGATRVTMDLARLWRPGRMVVLVRKHLPAALTVDPGDLPVRFLSPPARSARWAMPGVVLRLARAARHADALVVSGEIGFVVLLAWLAARIVRRPFVIAVHADLDMAVVQWVPRSLRPAFRAVHRRADGVIAVEQDLVAPLERNGLPPDRVRVVRNGIDVAGVRRAATAADPFADVEGPRIAVTGRLAWEKGADVAIRAHAEALRAVPHTLLVLNDGPEAARLHALADELGVADSVRFAGRMDPHPVVAGADLFCLPSRHEGLPLALLEAMAVGTPVVATECSTGVTGVLDHGRLGTLVPVDDVGAMARAFRSHLAAPEAPRNRAAAAGREVDRFTDTAMVASWVDALEEFIVRGSGRARSGPRASA